MIAGDEGNLLPSYPVWHQERFITLDIQHIKQRKSEERGGRRNEVFLIADDSLMCLPTTRSINSYSIRY